MNKLFGREILLNFKAEKKIVLLKADFREAVRSKVDSFGHWASLFVLSELFKSSDLFIFAVKTRSHVRAHEGSTPLRVYTIPI